MSHPPLSEGLALVVSGCLQVSLQTLLLGLQLLGIIGLHAAAGTYVLQLLQQFLLLIDEDEAVTLGVKQPWPSLTIQFGDLHLDGGNPRKARGARGGRVASKGEKEEEKAKRGEGDNHQL